ncbi:Outer membrane receptor proteins, mostly Fe transport [Lysobacter sp. cf310]|nr:Outer membrane receptor proteins, mostly Fe transport [Lysobacter sp. cf310]
MAKVRHTLAISSAFLLCLAAQGTQTAAAAPSALTRFAIRPGALDDALQSLATQSRVQILYAPALVARKRSAGLRAELAPAQALERLLQGSGLRAVRVNDDTFLLQLAPPAPAVAKPKPPRPVPPPPPRIEEPTNLGTVHVTGSHIPRSDLESVPVSPMTLIGREEIEASGHQTLFELLRFQPGMVGHHPVAVAAEGGQPYQQPFAAAATTSLNALGPRATLFLVDGQRIANYGLISADLGGLTDLDGIPLSIVERIEIIRGGASAIYGADAMAGVVNIILKKDQQGSEVIARLGVSDRNDAKQRRISVSSGVDLKRGGNLFLSADYFQQDGLSGAQRSWRTMDRSGDGLGDWRIGLGYHDYSTDITWSSCPRQYQDAQRLCYLDTAKHVSLQPEAERTSFYAHWRQPIGADTEVYADLRLGEVSQQLRGAPFYAEVTMFGEHPDALFPDDINFLRYAFYDVGQIRTRSVAQTVDLSAGIKRYRGDWEWSASYAHHENTVVNRIDGLVSLSAFNELANDLSYRFNRTNRRDVLSALSPRLTARGKAELDQGTLGINGPWFELPAGRTRVAAGLELGRDALENRPDPRMVEHDVALSPPKVRVDDTQITAALYAELSAPLASRLQGEFALRADYRERYRHKLSPKLGLKWNALDTLTFRGTWATGYRAPSLYELRRPNVADQTAVVQETQGFGPCDNPIVGPNGETQCLVSRSAFENTNLKPETSRSHTLGLVWSPNASFSLALDHFDIRRRNEILAVNGLAGDLMSTRAAKRDDEGELVGVQDYYDNVGETHVRGWEFDAEYRLQTQRWGRFTLRMAGNYLEQLSRRIDAETPALDYAGYGAPDRTALAGLQWSYGNWSTTVNARMLGSSRVGMPDQDCPKRNVLAKHCRNPGSTTLDLNLDYNVERWRFSLNVHDLGDRTPVNYDVSKGGYDIAYDDPRGRYFLLSAAYRF